MPHNDLDRSSVRLEAIHAGMQISLGVYHLAWDSVE